MALVGTLGVLSIGVIGFAHTPMGRPILPYLGFLGFGHQGLCPVGADRLLTDDEVDAARRESLAASFGTEPPAAKPALGFDLGQEPRADVERWVAETRATCAEEPHGRLRCQLEGTGPSREVLFLFDPDDRLVGVDSSTRLADAEAAAALLTERTNAVSASAGPPTSQRGEPNAAFLGAAPLRQASASFQYADYHAELAAMNLGQGRFAVRETYQSL
jgi:hypothetical protein